MVLFIHHWKLTNTINIIKIISTVTVKRINILLSNIYQIKQPSKTLQFTILLNAFTHYVLGLKVEVTHLSYPRKYKVKDVTHEPASRLRYILYIIAKVQYVIVIIEEGN